jgi:TPR repeat protein
MCNLGSLLITGAPGLDKDEQGGFTLLQAAAERGHPPAQFNLALCFGVYKPPNPLTPKPLILIP